MMIFRKNNLSIIIIASVILLLPGLKTKAQEKDSADVYREIISGNMYLSTAEDSIKDLKNELFNEIAISPSKDKLVLVRPTIDMIPSDLKEPFILWLIDLKTKHAIICKIRRQRFWYC